MNRLPVRAALRLGTALLVGAVLLVPPATAQPRDAGIAGGHAAKPGPYACNRGTPKWSPRQNRCVVHRVFPRRLWRDAERIIGCESGWDENNDSPTADHGLFQINRPAHPDAFIRGRNMHDPVQNAKYALRLHELAGWQPWTCARILGIR